MELNFERLRTLWLVSRLGSFVAVSRELSVTPSAISQQISALEESVGAELVQRQGRGVTLTPLGWSLAEQAGKLVASLEQTGSMVEELLSVISGEFRVSSIPTAALSVVRHAVLDLALQHPALELSVLDQSASASLRQLEDHRVDLAIIDVFDQQQFVLPEGLSSTTLGRQAMQLFIPTSMQFADGPLDLAQLSEADWICSPEFEDYSNTVRTACRAAGFEPRVRWETDDIFLMYRYVADGFGVALHPPFSDEAPPEGVSVREVVGDPIEREILAVSRSATVSRPVQSVVLDALKTAANNTFQCGPIRSAAQRTQ